MNVQELLYYDRQSTFTRTPIEVAVSVNANFLMALAVMLRSLEAAHPSGDVSVTVLYDQLRECDRQRVESSLSALELTWVEAPVKRLLGARFPDVLSQATLFRLLLPELLPTSDRVIYVDVDTLVLSSLRPLWDLDLGNHWAGAVRDAGNPFVAGPGGPDWRKLGLEPDEPYFNAGVLLISLEAWRSAAVPERALELLREFSFQWADQDALNVVLRGRWTELPRRWNLQTKDAERTGLAWALWREDVERALADPAVIHYVEHIKPWHPHSRHPFRSDWQAVLRQTSFAGWTPPQRPLHRRIGTRTKTAWHVLTAGPRNSRTSET